MKIDEIVALSKAGFTAEQIAQMSVAQTQQPTPIPTPTPTQNPMDALMAQVMNLTNMVQANALGNTNMPTPENADDILGAIINPPTKEAKK